MEQADPGVPRVVIGLMAANFAVYALWHTWGVENPAFMHDHFVVSLEAVRAGRVWTLLTSAFTQYDAIHLLVNLLVLWAFGPPVARVLGPHRFAALYLAGGFAASASHVVWNAVSGESAGAIGASGSVMAVTTAFAIWYPRAVILVGFLLPLPAWLAAVAFLGLDVLGVFGFEVDLLVDGRSRRVAHAAHLGGAVVGALAAIPARIRGSRRARDG